MTVPLPAAALVLVLVLALLALALKLVAQGRRVARLGAALRSARAGEARLRLLAEHSIDGGWIIDCAPSRLLYLSPAARATMRGADSAGIDSATSPASSAANLATDAANCSAGGAVNSSTCNPVGEIGNDPGNEPATGPAVNAGHAPASGCEALPGFFADEQDLVARLTDGLPQRLQGLLAGDESRRRQVRRFEQSGGADAELALEAVSTLIPGADGQPALLVGVLRDVSAQHRHELAQKRFASMLSHEFRSPLSTIDGAIQRLEMTGAGADEGTRKRYRKIANAVERLLELIDQHLSPERMAAIGRARQPDTVAPKALLAEAAARADSALHPVSARSGGMPSSLRCDPDGMRLCLQILLENAALYAPAGTPIELVGAAAAEGGVEFLVLDRGPGVEPDEAEHLFDKFFRGRHAAAHAGSGLGLYMARSVIEVHGGTLTVANRADGGAAFRIWLPFPAEAGKSLASSGCKSNNSSW